MIPKFDVSMKTHILQVERDSSNKSIKYNNMT